MSASTAGDVRCVGLAGIDAADCDPSGHTSRVRPPPLSVGVAARMARMPRSSTGPEIDLRRELHARGLRFRVQVKGLPGTPDVALTRARIAIFVDGCFWHGCLVHGVIPKHNRDWWASKLAANSERDRRKDQDLVDLGWLPLHFWEHTLATEAADEIIALWRRRTDRS